MSIKKSDLLNIGEVADRTGLAVSAIRFYEDRGLVASIRAPSGHRKFQRSTIRRLSFIKVCQSLGYSLQEISDQLAMLPDGRTPTDKDWQKLASVFSVEIDERIANLEALRDTLAGCIGCGCLSVKACGLYNPQDHAARLGAGPRFLLGDTPS